MAWTTPPVRATGDLITAAIWNQDVKDNTRYLKGLDGSITLENNLLFTDALYDIGASGATRPRSLYLSASITVGTTATIGGFTDITAGGLRVRGVPTDPTSSVGTTDARIILSGQNSATAMDISAYRGGTLTGRLGWGLLSAVIAGVTPAPNDLGLITSDGGGRAFFDDSDSGRLVLGGGLTSGAFTDITAGGLRVRGVPTDPTSSVGTTDARIILSGQNSATAMDISAYRGGTLTGRLGWGLLSAVIAGVTPAPNDLGLITSDGGGRAFFDDSDIGRLILGGGARVGSAGGYLIAGATSGVVTVTSAAVAGTWTMTLPTAVGAAGQQLTDAAGDGVCSWAAAASLREHKNLLGYLSPLEALDAIRAVPIHLFRYKPGMGTQDADTIYAGPVADETPWAMHYQGGIFNPVSAFGYTAAAIQAVDGEVTHLRNRVAALEAERTEAPWLRPA